MLLRINGSKLKSIQSKSFSNQFGKEKELQTLTEQNLETIFGLEFVSTEFNLESFWLDSLAFDPENKSFVIIEYKKVENFSLMDQGKTYLNLALEHKDSLLQEYFEKTGKNLKRSDVDWSQSRVIFIGPEFTVYQKRALSPDLPFELWDVKVYEDGIISYNPISPIQKSISANKSKTILTGQAAKEIISYTVEEHYKKASSETAKLLDKLREKVRLLNSDLTEKPVKNYIGYKISWYNFVSIHVYKDKLKIYVRKEKLEQDVHKRLTKVPSSYGWGKTALWWIDIANDGDLNYAIPIIIESYEAAPDR